MCVFIVMGAARDHVRGNLLLFSVAPTGRCPSLSLVRDLGKQRHLLLSLPLSCVAGQNLGHAQAIGNAMQRAGCLGG